MENDEYSKQSSGDNVTQTTKVNHTFCDLWGKIYFLF